MKRLAGAAIVMLAAGAAQAQAPSPPQSEARPLARTFSRAAEIRIERPDLSIFVRCGEGESAKSCAETVSQLLDKLAAMPLADRGDRRGRDERRGFERDRGFRDYDRDRE